MKTVFASFLMLAIASANIIFPFIQPICDFLRGPNSCLSGQVCVENNTCVPSELIGLRKEIGVVPRPDGRCGHDFGGASCDPNGPYGGCCSKYGWCGKTPEHCLVSDGCQAGCSMIATPAGGSSTMPSSASTAALSEPVISPVTTSASAPGASGSAVTTDGTCGAAHGGIVCGDWYLGSCCSMYGFCGNTSAHCGIGCQSGPCYQAPVPLAPSASPAPMSPVPGSFNVLGDSGVPAMHAALLPNGRVVFLDKIENNTRIELANGQIAYSAEYDPATNDRVGLAYKTNVFCSGGSFLANGTLINVGGNAPLSWLDPTVGNGFRGIRYLTRSPIDASLDGQEWQEPGNQLDTARWYASVQTMPDGTLFVASGSLNGLRPDILANNNPTYEILDVNGVSQGVSTPMELLVKAQPIYMYPFVHLLNDGTLFAFVSKHSEVFDVSSGQTVKQFPDLPGDYRTYPNTGGSVLLPLSSDNGWNADIIICGGGAYQDITSPTDPSCGRIRPLDDDATWEMDAMPEGRGMVEGTLLPDGTVLWVNGCNRGAEGFGLATDPTTEALIYDPSAPLGQRWSRGASTGIPRLYHSVALLLLDGTLMITGSNPNEMPVLNPTPSTPYITDFRVEIYTPPYLSGANADRRPTNVQLSTTGLTANSQTFTISFWAPQDAQGVKVALYHGGFVTHAVHMSHRMLFLDNTGWETGVAQQYLTVTMPPNSNVAPPGPYIVFIVVDGLPSIGEFVMVG